MKTKTYTGIATLVRDRIEGSVKFSGEVLEDIAENLPGSVAKIGRQGTGLVREAWVEGNSLKARISVPGWGGRPLPAAAWIAFVPLEKEDRPKGTFISKASKALVFLEYKALAGEPTIEWEEEPAE